MKYKIVVIRSYRVEHIVDANDEKHAKRILGEISETMKIDYTNSFRFEYQIAEVDKESKTTYEPK